MPPSNEQWKRPQVEMRVSRQLSGDVSSSLCGAPDGVVVMQGHFPKRFGEEVATRSERALLTEPLAIFQVHCCAKRTLTLSLSAFAF